MGSIHDARQAERYRCSKRSCWTTVGASPQKLQGVHKARPGKSLSMAIWETLRCSVIGSETLHLIDYHHSIGLSNYSPSDAGRIFSCLTLPLSLPSSCSRSVIKDPSLPDLATPIKRRRRRSRSPGFAVVGRAMPFMSKCQSLWQVLLAVL